MFGLEMMVKNMLDDMGIDINAVQREAVAGYQQAQEFAIRMVRSQSELVELMKVNYALQRHNAEKLDAICEHLGIELTLASISSTEVNEHVEKNQPQLKLVTDGNDSGYNSAA